MRLGDPGVRGDGLRFEVWYVVAPALIRIGNAREKQTIDLASINLAYSASGLQAFIEGVSSNLEIDPEIVFRDKDVINAFDLTAEFWRLYLKGDDPSQKRISIKSAPNLPFELNDTKKLDELSISLHKATESLPRSITEWRRDRYLTDVSQFANLISHVLVTDAKCTQAILEVERLLASQPLKATIWRAIELAGDESQEPVTKGELRDMFLFLRKLIRELGEIDQRAFQSLSRRDKPSMNS